MQPLEKIDWGDLDAYRDEVLANWIEPSGIRTCLVDKCWIITGEKGSGKSALCRAISERYASDYFALRLVNFDKVTFKAIYENLRALTSSTSTSSVISLANYWQYAIFVELLSECYKKSPNQYGDLWHRVPKLFRRSNAPSKTILLLIERAFDTLTRNLGATQDGGFGLPASSGLSATAISVLAQEPIDAEFIELCEDFYCRLERLGHRAIVIFDGFDTLRNDLSDPTSIQTIFSGLVTAIQNIRSKEPLPRNIVIKAFIPHDQFLGIGLRDSDKITEMHAAIRWDRAALEQFVSKRILGSIPSRSERFTKIWQNVMPLTFPNTRYNIEEDTFDYIVRHTMLRPRQLQIHLKHLASACDSRIVQPADIPKAIRTSSNKLAGFFRDEYGLSIPVLNFIFQTLHGKENVMFMRDLKSHILGAMRKLKGEGELVVDLSLDELDRTTNRLFESGFFGTITSVGPSDIDPETYYPPTKRTERHEVNFFYKSAMPNICSKVPDDALIAIHPIFHSYSDMRTYPDLIIG